MRGIRLRRRQGYRQGGKLSQHQAARIKPIRTLLTILLTLALAASVFAGLTFAALYTHDVDREYATESFAPTGSTWSPPRVEIPALKPRLGPRRGPELVPVEASFKAQRTFGSCRVRLTGRRAPTTDLCVAVFDRDSGARLAAWTLRAGTPLPVVHEFTEIPVGTQFVHVASSKPWAKIRYIARGTVSVSASETTEITLSAETRKLQLSLQDTGAAAPAKLANIAMDLRRRDDPLWRYMRDDDTGTSIAVLTDDTGYAEFVGLGPGIYELSMTQFAVEAAKSDRVVIEIGPPGSGGGSVERTIRGSVR